jgi:carboxyl-terminal processing protease
MSAPHKKSGVGTAIKLASVVILACALVLGVALVHKARAGSEESYEYLELFNQVLHIVQRDYVKEVDTKELFYGAIRGMLRTLDPHSVFLSVEDYKEMREDIAGEFGGLGIEIGIRNGWLTIIAPLEDTPAWKAGLKAGDRIVAIEDESTRDMSLNQAVHRMRGEIGTPVTISIMREGLEEPKDYTIIRDKIEIKSVREKKLMKGDIGYVKVITFTENTTQEVRKGLKNLKDQSQSGLKGIILDLRNNPGGPLEQAVKMTDVFLGEGVIVSVRGRVETQPPRYAHKARTIDDVPMVILVNQHSASASEIVAGALQDHGRAVIMGKTTFGKGSVQQLHNLRGGAGLKLTTAYYYTPSDRSIQEEGIHPDIEVDELSPEQKIKLKEAEAEERWYPREKDLEGHFSHEEVTGEKEGDTAGAGESPTEELLPDEVGEDTDDYQLQRALDLLRSFEVFQSVIRRKAG